MPTGTADKSRAAEWQVEDYGIRLLARQAIQNGSIVKNHAGSIPSRAVGAAEGQTGARKAEPDRSPTYNT